MPELPEVESLVRYLRGRVGGRTVDRVFPVAVSVLKTYEPAVTELEGRVCGDVVRWGKFLDVGVGGLRLVMHLGVHVTTMGTEPGRAQGCTRRL
ncbi:hypothetical protein OG422_07985 [Streptomyces sp. NBC_01525]